MNQAAAVWNLAGNHIYVVFSFGLISCLTSQSTAMVRLGWSVHLTTLFFLGKLDKEVNQFFMHILSLVTDNNPS